MDYTAWSKEHLEQHVVRLADNSQVSLWGTAPSEKPLLVFVHGIGGDRAGLVPLAAELEPFFRIALVELPGHGGSSRVPLPDVSALQGWFQAVLARIEEDIAPVAAICAHSFGCSAVLGKEVLARKKVILMNPVPTPSGMYATYARAIMDSAYFWAHIYNWRPLALLRGRVLMKIRTHDAIRRVHWVSRWSVATPDQVVYQAGLVDIILDKAAYRGIGGESVALVICGMFDTTAHERDSLDMEAVFGGSRTVFLRGGHLLPIEAPVRVASLVRESMVK
jgi:pimeloyl-ACP methyl ester carboxylesterase